MLHFAIRILASPESAVPESTDLSTMLACLFIFAAAALLAFFPIRSSKIRNHRRAEIILAGSILWAVLTTASIILPMFAKSKFAAEHQTEMMAGNVAPNDLSGAPAWPWPIWIALAVLYAALLFVSTRGEPIATEPPSESPSDTPHE